MQSGDNPFSSIATQLGLSDATSEAENMPIGQYLQSTKFDQLGL